MGQLREANETLIFQHIPKTAGTTLSFILTSHFQEQDIYHIRNLQQMRGPAYSSNFGSADHFRDLTPEERNGFRLILGHDVYGLHRYLNHPAKYITFVRDPVRRVISQYHQHQRMIKAHELDGDQLTLEQFLEDRPVVLNNHQTRFLSGLDDNSSSPEERYEQAIANIDKYFSLVGIVERFDESILLLSKIFCWPHVTYTRRNTTARKDIQANIDPSTIKWIEDANQLDSKLYQYATVRLDEKIMQQGSAFNRELRMFKRRQTLSASRHWIVTSVYELTRRLIQAGKPLKP